MVMVFPLKILNFYKYRCFISTLMNDKVYKFKRYEHKGIAHVGLNKHKVENIGLYDTIAKRDD
jgi:hypothetical protein